MIRSKTLPMPQTNISETTALAAVQDYMQIQWPAIQLTYDQSIFVDFDALSLCPLLFGGHFWHRRVRVSAICRRTTSDS